MQENLKHCSLLKIHLGHDTCRPVQLGKFSRDSIKIMTIINVYVSYNNSMETLELPSIIRYTTCGNLNLHFHQMFKV